MKVGEILEEMETKCIAMVNSVAMTMGQLLEEVENKMKGFAEGIPDMAGLQMPGQATYAAVAGKATQRT